MDDDTTRATAVCITVGNDMARVSAHAHQSGAEGSVFVGERIQLSGTPDQLRRLAAALIDGADDLAAQLVALAERDRQREHYGLAEAEERDRAQGLAEDFRRGGDAA